MSDQDPYAIATTEHPDVPATVVETVTITGADLDVDIDIVAHTRVRIDADGNREITRAGEGTLPAMFEAVPAGGYLLTPPTTSVYANDGRWHKAGENYGGMCSRAVHLDGSPGAPGLGASSAVKGAIVAARRELNKRAALDKWGPVAVANIRTFTASEAEALPLDAPIGVGDLVVVRCHAALRLGVAYKVTATKVHAFCATPSGRTATPADGTIGKSVRLYRAATPAPAPAEEPAAAPAVGTGTGRHAYVVNDRFGPTSIRTTVTVPAPPEVGEVLLLPAAGVECADVAWQVTRVEEHMPGTGRGPLTIHTIDPLLDQGQWDTARRYLADVLLARHAGNLPELAAAEDALVAALTHEYRELARRALLLATRRGVLTPATDHVTTILEPDSAGHWAWECAQPGCGENASGYDDAVDVVRSATLHGQVAAESLFPTPYDRFGDAPWTGGLSSQTTGELIEAAQEWCSAIESTSLPEEAIGWFEAESSDARGRDWFVWVATERRGVQYHTVPAGESATVCGRSTRTGVMLAVREVLDRFGDHPCVRCYPPVAVRG